MSAWLIGAIIWGVGTLVWFRAEAGYLVTRKNWPRAKAIREARNTAPWWPLAVLFWIGEMGWTVGKWAVTAGIPESRADRDEAIRRLEEEVLGATAQDARDEAAGQLHLTLQEALNGTTADEDADELLRQDMAYLDRLDASRGICGPDTRLPSGKTMGALSPAYRPRGYVSTHRPDHPRRGPVSRAVSAQDEAVTTALRALELLRRLAAMGATKDPFTGARIHDAIRDARHHLQDVQSGHMTAATVRATVRQVAQLERLVRSHEAIKDDDKAKVCTRCGCPVVQGRLGYIHIPTLGGPSACHSATIAPEAAVPWYLTPQDSPEREAVRRRLFGQEPQEVTSISLDGTETTFRYMPEGYEITYLSGEEEPSPFTRAQHRAHHGDSPRARCPFCQMDKL